MMLDRQQKFEILFSIIIKIFKYNASSFLMNVDFVLWVLIAVIEEGFGIWDTRNDPKILIPFKLSFHNLLLDSPTQSSKVVILLP